MAPRKNVLRFFAALIVAYGLLMIRWPGLVELYGANFAGTAHLLSYRMWGNGPMAGTRAIVRIEYAPRKDDPDHDVRIAAANAERLRGYDDISLTRTSSRHLGYMPTVVLISLIIASPVSWLQRVKALMWGLVFIHIFIGFRLVALLLAIFQGDANHCLYSLGPVGAKLLSIFVGILAEALATAYVVPLFIWIAVTFRGEDWKRFIDRAADPSP
jgi:hypothetical protein